MEVMKVEITKAQLNAIKHLCDDCEAMLGGSGDGSESKTENCDDIWGKQIKLIDRFFIKNGYKR